jgi:hypothetical protein
VWGLDTYDAWKRYLAEVAAGRKPLDLRATRLFWEHKGCSLKRIMMLETVGRTLPEAIKADSRSIYSQAKLFHLSAVAYQASSQPPHIIEGMIKSIGDMHVLDEKSSVRLLAEMN